MGDEFRISSGKMIRAARKQMGLSQIEVAEIADVSRRTVQNAESGNSAVKISLLRAIGQAVHLDFDSDEPIAQETPISNVTSFGYWPFRLFKLVGSKVKPNEFVFCHDEQKFLKILETLWENFEVGLAKFYADRPNRMLEVHPQFCSKRGYFDRYLNIWRANPKTFAFSATGGQRTGVAIVLPVNETTYKGFVAGQRSSFGILADEIVSRGSPFIVYESIAPLAGHRERSHSLGGTLGFTSLYQMSQLLPYVKTDRCDVASFGAHEENTEKIRRVGMEPTGTHIPGLGFSVWHLTNHIDFGLDNSDGVIQSSTMFHFLSLKQRSASLRAKLSFGAIGALQANQIAQRQTDKNRDVA